MVRNIKLILSYDGTDFNGWQTQPGQRTVQETLQIVIEKITGKRPHANASGRTDKGVHAVGQVVNFYTSCELPTDTFLRALNANLPQDISVREVSDASQVFDANKDALRKLYRYVIRDGPVHDPFMRKYYSHSKFPLDAARMSEAAKVLLGRHDFHSFETDWPNRLTSIRTITHISVNRVGEYVWLDVEADGFLYNMVRSIAGTLINIGRGFWPVEKMAEILQAEDRREAGPTAPGTGLFLMRVTYADDV